jgi:hypothetical protein
MAAAISHYLHAQKVFKLIKKQDHMPELNEDAFLWGAQGPDILYCYRIFSWQFGGHLRKYGIQLHNETPSKILCSMRKYYKSSNKDTILLSYIYGFLCHYSLDRIVHPFVSFGCEALFKQDKSHSRQIYHHKIESALDVILLRSEKGELPTEFNLKKTLPKDIAVQTKIAQLYVFLLHDLYQEDFTEKELLRATKNAHLAYGLLNDRTTYKKPFLEQLEKIGKWGNIISSNIRAISEGSDYDYANIAQDEWQWPMSSTQIRKESFFDLFEQSVTESQMLIQNFLTHKDFTKLTGEIPFIPKQEK